MSRKNIWEDVTRNAKRDNSNRAIAAYQANMPDAGAVAAFGGQEAYVQQKTAVSGGWKYRYGNVFQPGKAGAGRKDSSGKKLQGRRFLRDRRAATKSL